MTKIYKINYECNIPNFVKFFQDPTRTQNTRANLKSLGQNLLRKSLISPYSGSKWNIITLSDYYTREWKWYNNKRRRTEWRKGTLIIHQSSLIKIFMLKTKHRNKNQNFSPQIKTSVKLHPIFKVLIQTISNLSSNW